MALRYDSLRLAWNITDKHVLNMISGWLVVKYSLTRNQTTSMFVSSIRPRGNMIPQQYIIFHSESGHHFTFYRLWY
jgi:hypothetical protein